MRQILNIPCRIWLATLQNFTTPRQTFHCLQYKRINVVESHWLLDFRCCSCSCCARSKCRNREDADDSSEFINNNSTRSENMYSPIFLFLSVYVLSSKGELVCVRNEFGRQTCALVRCDFTECTQQAVYSQYGASNKNPEYYSCRLELALNMINES